MFLDYGVGSKWPALLGNGTKRILPSGFRSNGHKDAGCFVQAEQTDMTGFNHHIANIILNSYTKFYAILLDK